LDKLERYHEALEKDVRDFVGLHASDKSCDVGGIIFQPGLENRCRSGNPAQTQGP